MFSWSQLSKLHKKDPILHVATTFSLKQGETRTSHGPIPHPLMKHNRLIWFFLFLFLFFFFLFLFFFYFLHCIYFVFLYEVKCYKKYSNKIPNNNFNMTLICSYDLFFYIALYWQHALKNIFNFTPKILSSNYLTPYWKDYLLSDCETKKYEVSGH